MKHIIFQLIHIINCRFKYQRLYTAIRIKLNDRIKYYKNKFGTEFAV
jgi:hypothetical protein